MDLLGQTGGRPDGERRTDRRCYRRRCGSQQRHREQG
jgi:hypothetical protein